MPVRGPVQQGPPGLNLLPGPAGAAPTPAPAMSPLQPFQPPAPQQLQPILTRPQFIRKLASDLVAAGVVKRDQKLTPQDRTMLLKAYQSYVMREQERRGTAGTTAFDQALKIYEANQGIPKARQDLRLGEQTFQTGEVDLATKRQKYNRQPTLDTQADQKFGADLAKTKAGTALTKVQTGQREQDLRQDAQMGPLDLLAKQAGIGKTQAETARLGRSESQGPSADSILRALNQLDQQKMMYPDNPEMQQALGKRSDQLQAVLDRMLSGPSAEKAAREYVRMRAPDGSEYDIPKSAVDGMLAKDPPWVIGGEEE